MTARDSYKKSHSIIELGMNVFTKNNRKQIKKYLFRLCSNKSNFKLITESKCKF